MYNLFEYLKSFDLEFSMKIEKLSTFTNLIFTLVSLWGINVVIISLSFH